MPATEDITPQPPFLKIQTEQIIFCTCPDGQSWKPALRSQTTSQFTSQKRCHSGFEAGVPAPGIPLPAAPSHTKCLLASQFSASFGPAQSAAQKTYILRTDTDYSMDEPCKYYAQYKKFVTGHLLCASTYVRCPEQANPKTEQWLSMAGSGGQGRMTANGYSVSFWDDGHVLKLCSDKLNGTIL